MFISLIGHERNIGILTLTDYLNDKLGKNINVIMGSNYLNFNEEFIKEKINEIKKPNIIFKYLIPRNSFSFNQDINYPKIINEWSDVIFRVPTYKEEISEKVPLIFYKGAENPICKHINAFYNSSL